MASALFRLMAALGRNMILAFTFGGFALLVLFALGGFVLARGMILKFILETNYFIYTHRLMLLLLYGMTDDVAKWWLWGYYSSPMMYGMNAIAVNEFLGHQWHKVSLYV